MLFPTADFELFRGAKVKQIGRSLGLQNKIQLLLSVASEIYCPVRVIGTDGRLDLEPLRDLEEHLHIRIPIQRQGERLLYGGTIVDDVIIDAALYLDGVAVKVCQQLRRVENLLDIIFLAVQFELVDTVNGQGVAVVPDDLRHLLQKQLRVVKKVAAPSALQQDTVYRGGGEQGDIAEDGD